MQTRSLFVVCGILAVTVAACSSGGTSSSPSAGTQGLGSATLNANSQAATLPASGSISGIITYPGGSGSVTAATATAAPGSLTPLQSIARSAASARKSASAPANIPIVYITISSTAGATLNSAPAFVVNSPTTVTGTAYEAYWNGTEWITVGSAGTISAVSGGGSQVSVGGGGPSITIAAGASAYFVVYTGGVVPYVAPSPVPSPSPAPSSAGTNLIADPGFETGGGAYTPFNGTLNSAAPHVTNGTISTTGWTQCSVSAIGTNVSFSGGINGNSGPYTSATAPPVSKFEPEATETIGTTISSSGSPLAEGTAAPVPPLASVVVHGGSYAAVLGGVFSGYNFSDFAYNGLCQNVAIPAGANPSFSAWVYAQTNEASNYVENVVGILDNTGTLQTLLYMENVEYTGYSGDPAYRQISVPAPAFQSYAGTTVTLFIGMWTSSYTYPQYSSYWLVDDLTLK